MTNVSLEINEIEKFFNEAELELNLVTLIKGKKRPLRAYKDKSLSDVTTLAKEDMLNHYNIGIRTDKVVCLDLDSSKEGYNKIVGDKIIHLSEKANTFSQNTPSGGRHYIFKQDERMNQKHQLWKSWSSKIAKDIDMKIGKNSQFVMAGSLNKNKKYQIRDHQPPVRMPDELFDLIHKNCKFAKTKTQIKKLEKKIYDDLPIPVEYTNLTFQEELKEICDCFPNNWIDSYDDFLKIGTAIKNSFKRGDTIIPGGFQFFNTYCQKHPNYMKKNDWTKQGNFKAYEKFTGKCDKRYLYNQLKKLPNGRQKTQEIIMKYSTQDLIESGTDMDLAKLFLGINNNHTVCHNQIKEYEYSGHYVESWAESLEGDIAEELRTYFENCILMLINNEEITPENEKLIDSYKKIKLNCQSSSKIQAIKRFVIGMLKKDGRDIIWDNNPYLFAFKNCIVDLRTGITKTSSREDYIKKFSNCKYEKADDALILELNKIIESIFPIENERIYYLSILSTGMLGIPTHIFSIANGGGRNGKGLLHSLFMKLLGKYGYKSHPSVLQTDIGHSGNPAVANMDGARFILYSEPDLRKPLKTMTINSFTSCDGEVSGRALYSNVTTFQMKATHIMECNKKPGFTSEETDQNNTRERIRDIPFRSTFLTESPNFGGISDSGGIISKCNPEFKTPDWQEKMALPLFHILLPYAKEYIKTKTLKTPDSIRQRSYEYLDSNNIFINWFKENFQKLTKDKLALRKKNVLPTAYKLGELYELFCDSTEYSQAQNKKDLIRKEVYNKLSKYIGTDCYRGTDRKKKCMTPKFSGSYLKKDRKRQTYVIFPYIRKSINDEEFEEE